MENAFISHFIEPVEVRDLEHGGVNRVKVNADGAPMTVAVELQPLDGRSLMPTSTVRGRATCSGMITLKQFTFMPSSPER